MPLLLRSTLILNQDPVEDPGERVEPDDQLVGLVYSLTPKQRDDAMPWYKRPVTLAVIILVASTILNVIFW